MRLEKAQRRKRGPHGAEWSLVKREEEEALSGEDGKTGRKPGVVTHPHAIPKLWISGNIPEKRRGRERTSTGGTSPAGDDDFPKASATRLSPGRLQRHDLRESLEGEKERKNNTNARREGPRRLSLGEHRTANGDSSLSSNCAVTRPRVSKVTTTRRRLQGDQLGDFYCMRKNKKRHTRRQVSS